MSTVRELAEQADAAIRAANHITITPHGDMRAPDLYRVVAELASLTRGVDQLCRQLDRNLHRRIDTGGLRHDAFADPVDTAVTAAASLRLAARFAADASRVLDGAMNPLCHLADTGDLPR